MAFLVPSLSPDTVARWQHSHDWRQVVLNVASSTFRAAVHVRNAAHDTGLIPEFQAPLPVISIGNLETGGTGKTAIVRHLARVLPGRVAIVTRGYGNRLRRTPHLVTRRDPASLVGDEARLLARWLPDALVVVAPRRHRAFPLLEGTVDWVLLDDGFQHRALRRDVDIVVLPPVPSTRLLPEGMAREPLESLRRASLLWLHAGDGQVLARPNHLEAIAPHLPRVVSRYQIDAFTPYDAWRCHEQCQEDRRQGTNKKWHIVTGIGRPGRVGRLLKASGHTVASETWTPDHRFISTAFLEKTWYEARQRGADAVLLTEKDAIRYDERTLDKLSSIPLYVLQVSVEIVQGAQHLVRTSEGIVSG